MKANQSAKFFKHIQTTQNLQHMTGQQDIPQHDFRKTHQQNGTEDEAFKDASTNTPPQLKILPTLHQDVKSLQGDIPFLETMQSREHFIEVHESSRLHVQFHAQQQPAIPHALSTINQQHTC